MNMRVVLATANKGKVAELAQALREFGLDVLSLEQFPDLGEISEDGQTFAENALIKARALARHSGLMAIADDSGLSVDALDGAPGVFSARFADDWPALANESRDERNIRKLLHVMKGQDNRKCHFSTAMAAVSPDGRELVRHGEWHGQLLHEALGNNGFGYDPIFWDSALGRSAAQLSRAEKNAHSHRGKALANLLRDLPDFMATLKK